MRRRIRRLRQLVPTKFHTVYERVDSRDEQTMSTTPMYCAWWMWLGRCFKVDRREVRNGHWQAVEPSTRG